MRGSRILPYVLLLLAVPVALAQQPTTGAIVGTVLDNENKPLPGATVTLTGGASGTSAAQTDADGNFEFRFLPPAVYRMRVEMEGFAPVQFNKVPVNTGSRTRVPVKLQAGKTEEITVTSATPLIDVKKSEVTTTFRTDQAIQTMPIGRNFTAAVAFAPGVVSGGGTGQGNYSIGGSSGLENSYLIDGVNITDTGYGGVGTYSINYGSLGTGITSDFLEEIQVKTAGFEAEYGQALGGVVTGTVRSGTNELKGSVGAYYEPRSLNAQGEQVRIPGGVGTILEGTGNIIERQTLDIGLQLGGPLLKDRFFWFAAYNPVQTWNDAVLRSTNPENPVLAVDPGPGVTYTDPIAQPSSDVPVRGKRTRNNYAAKLSGLITPNHRVELTAFGDPSRGYGNRETSAGSPSILFGDLTGDGIYAPVRTPAAFGEGANASTIKFGADQQSLKYNGLFGADFFLESQVNHRENNYEETSTVNDYRFRDRRIFLTTGIELQPVYGGSGFVGPTSDKSWDYALKASKTFGDHEVKAGVQYFDLKYSQISRYSGPTLTVPFAEGALNPETGEYEATGGTIPLETTSGALVDIRGGFGEGNCDPTNPIYDPEFAGTTCDANPVYRITRARFNDPGETTANELALFIQDTWTINDNWTVKLGVRSTTQELEGAGEFTLNFAQVAPGLFSDDEAVTYSPNSYKFKTEYSPRLGVIFDPTGDGRTKIYANGARYFQRVPSDLAVRQFSNEFGISRFQFTDPNLSNRAGSTGSPLLQGLGTTRVEDGTRLPYVDEYVLGVQRLLRSDLSVEVRGIFRKQGRTLEDVQYSVLEATQNYYYGGYEVADAEGNVIGVTAEPFPGFGAAPFGEYVLANPGDNTQGPFTKGIRDYKALEVQLEKRLQDNWQAFFNYRYSRLRGNYEGLFRNDNGQSDPNITSLFDFPNSPLMRGQYDEGALFNDRPHVMHMGGTYFWDNGLEAGAILTWQAGIPRTALLAHPNYQNPGEIPGINPIYFYIDPATATVEDGVVQWQSGPTCLSHDVACFLAGYTNAPRGNLGRTPDLATLDLHFGWGRNIGDTRLKLGIDITNVFNNQEAQNFDDFVEDTAATPNGTFQQVIGYQAPRAVRFSAIWDF